MPAVRSWTASTSGVDRGVEDDGGQLADLGLVEGAEDGEQLAAAQHGVERGDAGVAGDRTVGHDHGEAPVGGPLGHTDDHPQRAGVQPLGLVDHQGRAVVHQAGDQCVAPPPLVVGRWRDGGQAGQGAERVVDLYRRPETRNTGTSRARRRSTRPR